MKKEEAQQKRIAKEIDTVFINRRLKTYVTVKYKSVNEAAQLCGVPQTTLANMFDNKSGPSVVVLLKLLDLDPEMDLIYILTGKKDYSFLGITEVSDPVQAYAPKPNERDLVHTLERLTDAITGLTISNIKKTKK